MTPTERADLIAAGYASQDLHSRLLAGILEAMTERPQTAPAAPRSTGSAGTGQGGAPGPVASDSDLDGQYGNEPVYRDPPKWTGESQKGRRLSECTPEFLDSLASFMDWKAANPQPGKESAADYARKDAARARGWAKRIRARESGGQGPSSFGEPPPDFGPPPDDELIPFATNEGRR